MEYNNYLCRKLQAQATAADGTVTTLTTPPSDVKYALAGGSWIAVRPSGTEPRNQVSTLPLWGESNEDSQAKIANIEAKSMPLLNRNYKR